MTSTPQVYNVHRPPIPKDAVYIGRGSQWGNPFKINKNQDRSDVIRLYKDFYYKAKLYQYINDLKGRNLVCFCAPLPCHGDFLLKQANKAFRFRFGRQRLVCQS